MRRVAHLFILAAFASATVANAQAADTVAPFGAVALVSNDDLHAIAGKSDIDMVVNAENRSTVANNSVSGNSITGTISFDGSSFADLNGLSLLSANTGNNVAINSSLNVNVAIRP